MPPTTDEANETRGAIQFKAVRPRRVFEEIGDQIRQDLVEGKLRPGDKLPAERLLAEQFSVSRAALRESLRALEFAGIVSLQKGANGGAVILDGTFNTVTQAIADVQRLGRVTLPHIAETRTHILELVIRLAIRRATEADLNALDETVARTAEYVANKDLTARMAASTEFYRLLAAATGNQLLVMLNESLDSIMRPYVAFVVKTLDYDVVRHRRKFMKLFRAKDEAKAVAEMMAHLNRIHVLIDAIESPEAVDGRV